MLTINFDQTPNFSTCFLSRKPQNIVNELQLLAKEPIIPGKTLLFLDEIQESPEALSCLRYFKEEMPELHVIGAGSLLEFALLNHEVPVGRVRSLYLRPLSFYEFLLACQEDALVKYLEEVDLKSPPSEAIHHKLLDLVRDYFVVGGMPEAVLCYLNKKDYYSADLVQGGLLEYYEKDFFKYPKNINVRIAAKLFRRAHQFIGRKFVFSQMDPDTTAKDQKIVLEALYHAGVLTPIFHTSASLLPLEAGINAKFFKLLFLDLGLCCHASGISSSLLLDSKTELMNEGALCEQFVGQELLAYLKRTELQNLYYWHRVKKNSSAELDYVLEHEGKIIPLEVKAGLTGNLKSLQVFMQDKNSVLGLRISKKPLSFERGVLTVPFYLLWNLAKLINRSL